MEIQNTAPPGKWDFDFTRSAHTATIEHHSIIVRSEDHIHIVAATASHLVGAFEHRSLLHWNIEGDLPSISTRNHKRIGGNWRCRLSLFQHLRDRHWTLSLH